MRIRTFRRRISCEEGRELRAKVVGNPGIYPGAPSVRYGRGSEVSEYESNVTRSGRGNQ
jgi:hypothetical protein